MTRWRSAAAVGVMGAIVAALFVLCTPRTASGRPALGPADADHPAVRVLALDFNRR